jgi:CxxC motif-containing protein (DUF1111 family)
VAAFVLSLLPELSGQSVSGQIGSVGQNEAEPEGEPAPKPSVDVGRTLFLRDWTKHKRERGDGLGPMYNAVSCVACHKEGGTGGSGKNDANVDLLSVISPRPKRGRGFSMHARARLRKIHPDFNERQLSITIHKTGQDDLGKTATYDAFRRRLLGWETDHVLSVENPRRMKHGFELEFSQRSTPALFGAGLIDQVSDRELIELARHQADRVPGISGRVPQTATASVGRFGWRGQVGSLHDFVLGACVNELGLQVVEGQTEPLNPIEVERDSMGFDRQFTITGVDLTSHETQSLTAFIASLPAPALLNGISLDQSKAALDGEEFFQQIGCSDCHVKDVGPAKGVYSDLLLHDMGPVLADALASVPEINERTAPGFSSYYGSSAIEQLVNVTTNIRQEWRTPPLWGVADSGPWLHDGRAGSLDAAIRLHGGEGAAAARKFTGLRQKDRDRLLAFLKSLGAPGAEPRPVFFQRNRIRSGFGSSGIGAGFFSLPGHGRPGLDVPGVR